MTEKDKANRTDKEKTIHNLEVLSEIFGGAPHDSFLGLANNLFAYFMLVDPVDEVITQYRYKDMMPHLTDGTFTFLFGLRWADYDNTPKGFSKRIEYLIDIDFNLDSFNYEDFKEGWTAQREEDDD